ncbi:MAG: STAS domain-containing protein [Solirubrobacterales bacterium]|nr:STAS domain-containing protein [Solirubrobacterales bacterium]
MNRQHEPDLRRVTFLDSSGVHAVLRAHRRSRELKRYMAVMPGKDVSRRILELTGVLDLLEVEPTQATVV